VLILRRFLRKIFSTLFLCVTCLHEAAFDVNGHWEEVDEEKS